MRIGQLNSVAFALVVMSATTAAPARGQGTVPQGQETAVSQTQTDARNEQAAGPMVSQVREATAALRDPEAAMAVGYALASGCVSGPAEGAMGVHYGNAALLGDGLLDVTKPETLVYEPRNGRLELVAAEYVVIAQQWHANNEHP